MSVNRTYKLPWTRFDPQEIEAAATAVAASFPGLRVTVERFSDTAVHCYFILCREPGDVPLEWRLRPHFELLVGPGGAPVALPMQVEVDFSHLPANADSPQDLYLMSVDQGRCWNEALWPLATEIMDRFCRYWGIEPEWW